MSHPLISFQVRVRSAETLDEIGARVTRALGCRFEPSEDREFFRGEGLESYALGLRITLSHDPGAPDGEERIYILRGLVRDDIAVQQGIDPPTTSISKFIFGVMKTLDQPSWYIATKKELLEEAKISGE